MKQGRGILARMAMLFAMLSASARGSWAVNLGRSCAVDGRYRSRNAMNFDYRRAHLRALKFRRARG